VKTRDAHTAPERDLAQLLSEAEATIQALLSGQIDAVVDPDTKTPVLLFEAQQRLRDSEERHRRIVETANEGIGTLDLNLKITFLNRRFADMFGYSVEELLGRSICDLMFAGNAAKTEWLRERPLGISEESEVQFVRKDGSRLWALLKTTPIRDSDGKYIGTLAMMTDWTYHKQSEEDLRSSEAQYRQIVESTTDGIIKIDSATRIVFINGQFAEMLNYAPEEMIGTSVFHFMGQKFEMSPDAFQSGRSDAVDATFQHKDGSVVPVNIARSPLSDKEGHSIGSLWMVRNFTEQNKLQEQLRQSQKMDAIGQLAGGMAHDFNNLLTVINGYSDLAIGRLQPADPLQRDMTQIKLAGQRAAALTRQLLAFSRKQVLLPTILNLNVVIQELEAMLHRLIGEDIDCRSALLPEAGSIKADRGQIEQVIMNFVINARDAMPSGGKLTIETQNVDLTEDFARQHRGVKVGPHVMLAVTDTGIGMDAPTQARIFDPFFTTKEAGKGTGLGLSTVYGIVQQSGGSVWVYSEVGRGTTFRVYFPRVGDDPRRFSYNTAPKNAAQGTETVLLTEDDDMVRALTKLILTNHGYHVLEAASGDAAILVCKGHADPIHLVITDMVMTGISGRDLVDRLGLLRPEMKVLYMSGYTDKAIVHQQALDETTPFLQKPFAPQSLLTKVREVLDRPA
jgi:two-component system cell cycle sensor histidine kinase/response regulator CckA